jgi:ADP-heptose:LPS heptosyltransferase
VAKPKLLLTAFRAYGDFIYSCPVLPYLFEKYDVFCDMNLKGDHLFHDDPRFAGKALFIFEDKLDQDFQTLADERKIAMRAQVKPDAEIDLNGTLEGACIARREQPEYHRSVGDRRVIFGSNGFYDAVFKRCGIPVPDALDLEGLWFPPELLEWGVKFNQANAGKFVVLVPVKGSSIHKHFRNWKEVVLEILGDYPDALVYLTGDDKTLVGGFTHPRVKMLFSDKVPFKQMVLLTKHVDMVVGPETGLMVAAGMWGTPKVMMCSASSVWQTSQYTRNDFSIQLPWACSPCHLSVFELADCEAPMSEGDEKFPSCVSRFPVGQIMRRVRYVHENLRRRVPQ